MTLILSPVLVVLPACPQEIASFQGFRSPWWKQLLYYIAGILTAGCVLVAILERLGWICAVRAAQQFWNVGSLSRLDKV